MYHCTVQRRKLTMHESHEERVHTEPVVLDIGGDIGALVIYTPADWCGREVELSQTGSADYRVHNQVHERSFNGRSQFAAVYPELVQGRYDILDERDHPVDTVTIVGGQVAAVHLT
jgi:hypothetical protein